MAPKRSFTLNPLWNHYLSFTALVCALTVGLFRYGILDRVDPLHCHALLGRGRWLDTNFGNWQPEGCMLYNYQDKNVESCLGSRQVVFIGDSVTRQLFFQFAQSLDKNLPAAPPSDDQKHADYTLHSAQNVQLTFHWDPFLNTSTTQSYTLGLSTAHPRPPALLVLGSGLWYLRYPESGGLPEWEAMMESTLDILSRKNPQTADAVVILPVEDVVSSKLSPDRAASMHASDIDAMNSDLAHRVRPSSLNDPWTFMSAEKAQVPHISFPSVFNAMIDPSQTEDGLHFSNAVVRMQARVLLNLRCNNVLPKVFPLDKTCCTKYPWPSLLHFVVLAVTLLWGPVYWWKFRQTAASSDKLIPTEAIPAVIISASIAIIYLADRTGFWLKEQKQFDPYTFSFLCLLSLMVGLLTVKQAESDLGFLNRDQTDEWKGWMQIAILIYHYTGASKISGIYNPIRVLVASYLFMTGYGHTSFYLKKADFGFGRVAQVLVRLNLYTVILAYTMNTDYVSYYFSPLVSWWYLIIYGTMLAGSRFNDQSLFVVCKILLSMILVTFTMRMDWMLKILFSFMERVFGIHWSAREWGFRVNLDIWIVYVGMLTALAVIKFRELRIGDHPRWPLAVRASAVVSAIALVWYFAFELSYDKFTYNTMHPAVAMFPIGAFVVLRNANAILRSASSKAFAFIGKCSLETFVIQYHFWLAGDTKGILIVIPATRWRALNMALTTILFVYVSDQVAHATGDITKWICSAKQSNPSLPMPVASTTNPPNEEVQEIIFLAPPDDSENKDEGETITLEPDTPIRPHPNRGWADRLAAGQRQPRPDVGVVYEWVEQQMGVKSKLLIALMMMWLLNVLWTYPPPITS